MATDLVQEAVAERREADAEHEAAMAELQGRVHDMVVCVQSQTRG